MARGRRTDLPTAATAKAMSKMGFQTGQIAETIGLAEGTVDDIVNERHGWSRMLNNPVFNEYRLQQKRLMQSASIELAKKALAQVEKELPQTSAPQAAVIYGIMRDKERLDAGEPTQHVALIQAHQIEDMDKLAENLSAILKSRNQHKIDKPDEKEQDGKK